MLIDSGLIKYSKYYDEVKKGQLGNYEVYEYNGVKYLFGNDLNSDKVRK